ncbi:kinase-like protein, partial [Martensiomyces pterosporus]
MYKVPFPDDVKYTVAADAGEDAEGFMVIGSYSVDKEVGSGSYGTVYRVKHKRTGQKYAMKVYHKAGLRKRVQSAMMKRARGGGPMRGGPGRGGLFAMRQVMRDQQNDEAADPFSLIKMELAISKKLKHNNLVRLYEVLNDPEQDVLYLIMDLCENGPVQRLNMEEATAEPISAKDAHKYFTHALLGLEYLHEHDIIHRDIKPDNMLLTEDGTLKITDFGESILLKQHGEKIKGTSGTPAFMAPELCQGLSEVSGEATDIWSLGICLYSFIYGKLPFKGSTLLEVFDSIAEDELRFPGPHDGDLNDLISCMLERNPDKRITIADIRMHPWVTQNSTYQLPDKETNCQNVVLRITQEDLDNVIQPIYDIMPVIRAVAKLKRFRRRIKERHEREQQEQQQR